MNPNARWVHLAEVALFYILAIVTIWWGDHIGPSFIPIVILAGGCVASNLFHRDGAERIGFSKEEFAPCARSVAAVCVLPLIPLVVLAWRNRMWAPWDTAFALAGYPVWSFAQEYAMLGFVTCRLEDGLSGHAALIPWINALLFSMAHLPNPVLMTVTFVSAVLFTTIFRRHRQLFPIAIGHALFGVCISLAFSKINGIMSVGPGYYLRVGTPRTWW